MRRSLSGQAARALGQRILIPGILAFSSGPSATLAANATWTASSNGAWDTGSNWSTGAAASGSSSKATFGAASGTGISINTAVTIGTLQFNSGAPAYSLAVNSNASLTLGASGIVNNSSNPFTLTVNSNARVNFNGTASAGNSILFLNSGGILDFSNSTGTLTAGSLAGSSSTNVYLGSRTLTVGSLNSNTQFQGILSDGGNSGLTGGSLTKVGTGTLILQRDNTYTGTTTINGGVLQIGTGGSTGSILGNVVDNASLVFNRGGTYTFAGAISGTGTVTKAGSGTVTLSGTNTYSGGTLLNAGSLQASANANLGNASGGLTFNGGTLLYGAGFSSARNVALTGAGTFNTNTFSSTLSGTISGAGALTKSGAGTLTLTGSNTYSGNTTVSGGTLQIGNGGTVGAITGNVAMSTSGAVLAFSRSDNQTFAGALSGIGSVSKLNANTLTLSGANTYSGGTTIGAGTLILTGSNTGGGTATISSGSTLQVGAGGTTGSIASAIANSGALAFNRSDSLSYGGVISGTGTLTKQGAGTLVLTGNSTYTGLTTISGGTLQIGNGGTTGIIGGDIVNNGILAFNRSDDFSFDGDISGSGSLLKDGAGTLTLTGTISYTGTTTILGGALFIGTGGTTGSLEGDLVIHSALTFNRADDYLYTGVISGTGSLTKMGAGTLTFTGENLYTGGTTISQGALQLGNGGTTGSIVGDVVDNSSLLFNHSNNITFDGAISGTGTVTKLGAGALTLNGANTYSGGTTLSAGTLILTGANTGGGTATIGAGSTLQIGNGGTTGSFVGNVSSSGVLAFNRSDALSFGGAISGTGILTKMGAGALTLTGNNTYTGATSINLGTLILTGANTGGGTTTIGAGSTLQIGNGGTTGTLAGDVVDNGILAFNRSDDFTFGGGISGSGSLIKDGAGTLTLTGAVTYTGTTTINGGQLFIGTGGSVGGDLVINTALTFDRADTYVYGGAISGTGSVTKLGVGTLVYTGANTYTGGTTISAGTLQIGNGGTTGSLVGDIANYSSLVFNRSNDFSFGGVISGPGAVIKTGMGALTLTGANTYTGGTTISDGILQIGNGGTSGNLVGNVTNNAALAFNRSDDVNFSGVISGTGSLTKHGAGTLTLTGGNTYSGGTTISAGALQIGNGGTAGGLAGGPVEIAAGGTLVFNRSDSTHFSAPLSGSGALLKLGAGQLVLDGASTFTGTTTVSAGTLAGTTQNLRGSIVNNGAVYFDQDTSGTYAGSISGTGSLAKQGHKLVLTGANTYTGATNFVGEVEVMGAGASINGTSGITLASIHTFAQGTLRVSGGSIATPGALVLGEVGGGWLHLTNAGSVSTASAILGLNAGSSGTALVASGASGGWTNTGTLVVGAAGTGSLTVENNSTLSAGSIVLGQLAGSSGTLTIGLGVSPATIDTATITGGAGTSLVSFHHNTASYTFAPQLAGSLGVEKRGNGTTVLSGSNTYTGGTILRDGVLSIMSDGNLGDASGGLTFDGGTLLMHGATSARAITLAAGGGTIDTGNFGPTLSGVISGSGSLTMIGDGYLFLTGANTYTGGTFVTHGRLVGNSTSLQGSIVNDTLVELNQTAAGTYAGSMSGSGALLKQGSQLTLTGVNTYTGATTVAGVLEVNGGVINGTSGITLAPISPFAQATLRLNNPLSSVRTSGSVTVGQIGTGVLSVTNGSLLTSADGTLGAAAGSVGTATVSGSSSLWSNTGALTVGGSGTGVLTVSDGGLVTASNLRLGDVAGSSGTLNIGMGATAGALNTAAITGGVGATSTVNFNHNDSSYLLASQLGGNLSVNQIGSGTTILTGTNTYTGVTTISGGMLQIGNGGTTGSIVGDIVNNGILAFNRSDDFSFGGAISGTGSLIKDGAGTLTLTGSVTYSGTTTVLGGALLIGTGGNTGNWDGDLNINSTLTFNRSDDLVYSHVVSGTGSVTKLGTGTLTYTNSNTYTGGTTVSVGTLQIGNGGTTGSIVGNVTNNANLTFNRVDDVAFAGNISGTGTLTKLAAGTLTLTAANTYSGGTTINAGTLQVGNGGTTGSIAGNVTNNSALIFNRSNDLSYGGAITGTGTFTKLGDGKLVVTGNNTYTGATRVTGTLEVSGGGRIEGTSDITVAKNALDTGTLRVKGSGSRVTTPGSILVGNFGSGALAIEDGGTVTAASIILGAESGSTGILNIGAGGAAGFLNAATVVDGAGVGSAVVLNHSDSGYTLASNLLHTLGVYHNGAGTTTLTGTNSYTGGTHLNAGILRVTSNSSLGGAASALNFNGGTLQWGATVTNLPRAIVLGAAGGTIDTGTFSVTSTGALSGTGGLTKIGSGTLTLSGTSTYTGGTTVSAGQLRGTTNSLKNNILNNSNVTFLQTSSGTYAGVMSGSGSLTKLNAGNLTLSGANTYTGATTISGGTLTLMGSLASPVTTGESATLSGTGTINGAVSVMGTLAPGNPATAPFGTLTVNGNLTFAPGSILRVQTNELGDNGKVNVVGAAHTATLNGGTVEVVTGGGEYATSTPYTLLTAAGGVTGGFDGVTSDFAFLTPSLSYDANHVLLTLERNDMLFSMVAEGDSEKATASYLDTLASDRGAAPLIRSITNLSASQADAAFGDLSGTDLTEMSRVSMANTARLFEMLASRLGTQDAGAGTGLAFSTLATGGARTATLAPDAAPGSGFWARQFVADTAGSLNADSSGAHTAIGFDAALSSGTVVGVTAAYTRNDVDLNAGQTRASRIRTPQVMAYASHTTDTLQLRGVVGCGNHNYDTERSVALGAATSAVSSRHEARECTAYAQAELGDGTGLRPLVGVLYSRLDESRYVETGGLAALAVAPHGTQSLTSNTGVRFSHALANERGIVEARAIWSHEYGDVNPTLRASLAGASGNSSFLVRGDSRSRDSAILGAGIAMQLGRGFLFHTDYNFQLGADRHSHHTFVAGLRLMH